MRILVTGATGFIGKAYVRALVAENRGYDICCAVRRTSDIDELRSLGLKSVHFDLDDPDTFEPAVKGMDTVVHFAANFNFHATRRSLQKYNVEATMMLAEACIRRGVEHFIYCSSTESVGVVVNGTEVSDYRPDDEYGRSKRDAERILLTMKDERNLPVTIVRPSGVFGPGDRYVFKETIEAVDHGVVKALPGSGKDVIHFTFIDDIIQGFLKITGNPTSVGQIYILCSDKPQTYNEMFETIAKELGRKASIHHVPVWMGRIGLPLLRLYYRTRGIDLFPLRRDVERKLTSSRSYLNSKAKTELGFKPEVEFGEGVRRTIAWMKEEGFLKK